MAAQYVWRKVTPCDRALNCLRSHGGSPFPKVSHPDSKPDEFVEPESENFQGSANRCIVMESISLIDNLKGETKAQACEIAC
jgi:hypothetical protein